MFHLMMPIKSIAFACLSSILSLGALAHAQGDKTNHIRFIALGERAVTKEEFPEGHLRVDPAPPKGSIFPREVALISGDQAIPFQLDLREFTKVLTMADSTEKLKVKLGETPTDANWFSELKPKSSLSLGVIFQNSAKKSWMDPRVFILKDDEKSFKPGDIRFVNVSENTVFIRLGQGKPFGLLSGKSSIKGLEVGGSRTQLGYLDGKSMKMLFENQIKVLEGQRVHCFFYTAEKDRGNGPVGFRLVIEEVPELLKLPGVQ